jgi:hypothetical protein
LWAYSTGSGGFESPYGNYPLSTGAIADGKVYVYSTEHTPSAPLWRGARLRCINASNGVELWSILTWASGPAIAEGYLVTYNAYDSQIHCFGKGPSATTASASPEISVRRNSVLIKGTVTDQSTGAKDTPAKSDASMGPWMEYLYMQQPRPTNATGVGVTLDAVDPNGNFVHIGNVTRDTSGLYSYMWTPEIPGKYTVIAALAGSESYL